MIEKTGISPLRKMGLLFFLVTSLYTQNASASFSTDRIRVILSAANPIQSIRITANANDPAALIQVTAVNWSQKDGKDVYTPTKDLIISPPFMRVAPGSTQVLRVGLRKPHDPNIEGTYRINIKEVTPHSNKPGIEFRLNESLPIFIAPDKPSNTAILSLKATKDPHRYTLKIKNTGNTHLQLISLKITDDKNKTENITGNPLYVLSQQEGEIPLNITTLSGNTFQLAMNTDSGQISQSVTLSP